MIGPVPPSFVATAGFYGKLPGRGDFVGHGLSASFIRPWDDWLQVAMTGARQQLGARWDPAWMQAPIWRFLLPAGMCGPVGMLGLWMPSVDRAGRHFPLTFARPAEGAPEAFASRAAGWLEVAELAGFAALDEALGPAGLAARLDAEPPKAAAAPPAECAAAASGAGSGGPPAHRWCRPRCWCCLPCRTAGASPPCSTPRRVRITT
ncbi:type VI secretion system-associated protein TagF [Siccirubricoccus deserti]